MDFTGFLAMTGAEIAACASLPPKIAYMSCHFSPYSTGISCVPCALPPGSVLMLADRTPIAGHDPERIARQLGEASQKLSCSAVVLDLQRESPEAAPVVDAVLNSLACPVVVSELYAEKRECAVLVSAPRLWTPLREHLQPWQGRQLWLEAVTDSALVTVTEAGSRYEPCDVPPSEHPLIDEAQHVLYEGEHLPQQAEYHLRRNHEQLAHLLEEARQLGVSEFLGLYQQLN